MKTIWKVALTQMGTQDVRVPEGAEFLCAREQNEKACVWFRCDPNHEKKLRRIAVVGTGHEAPDDGRYLGTAMLMDGSLVLHVFER